MILQALKIIASDDKALDIEYIIILVKRSYETYAAFE
jgi:hypothetical protein